MVAVHGDEGGDGVFGAGGGGRGGVEGVEAGADGCGEGGFAWGVVRVSYTLWEGMVELRGKKGLDRRHETIRMQEPRYRRMGERKAYRSRGCRQRLRGSVLRPAGLDISLKGEGVSSIHAP